METPQVAGHIACYNSAGWQLFAVLTSVSVMQFDNALPSGPLFDDNRKLAPGVL